MTENHVCGTSLSVQTGWHVQVAEKATGRSSRTFAT
jgi:hypothetical protein